MRRSIRGSGVLAALVLLTACSDAPPPAPAAGPATSVSPPGPTPIPQPGLAAVHDHPTAGLVGELRQFRRDQEPRRLQVHLTASNPGLVVEAVELHAPGLPTSPGSPRAAELPTTSGLDLPVVMSAADCATAPGTPVAEVTLTDATGARRTVAVPLEDGGLVRRLHDAECADQAVREQVGIEVGDVRPVSTADGPALQVTITFSRRSGSDPLRVTGTGSNTIYDITPAGPLPTLGPTGSVTLVVEMVPARCDVHALGESYRTGLIGLVLALGEEEPRPFVLTPEDEVRRRLETFAVDTCRATPD